MSWQVFTLIQVLAFSLAAVAALVLRNRGLRRRNDQLLSLCAQAHTELVNVTDRLGELDRTPSPEQLLTERIRALVGDDPVDNVRRLVLENEITPSPDFPERLTELLKIEPTADVPPETEAESVTPVEPGTEAADLPPEEEFVRRWRSIREECQQLAMFLVADNPALLPGIRQLFDIFAPLDHVYRIDMPEVSAPPESTTAAGETQDPDASPADAERLDQAALDALLEANRAAQSPAADEPTASADVPGDAAQSESRGHADADADADADAEADTDAEAPWETPETRSAAS